jgi:hypothetical protein
LNIQASCYYSFTTGGTGESNCKKLGKPYFWAVTPPP